MTTELGWARKGSTILIEASQIHDEGRRYKWRFIIPSRIPQIFGTDSKLPDGAWPTHIGFAHRPNSYIQLIYLPLCSTISYIHNAKGGRRGGGGLLCKIYLFILYKCVGKSSKYDGWREKICFLIGRFQEGYVEKKTEESFPPLKIYIANVRRKKNTNT